MPTATLRRPAEARAAAPPPDRLPSRMTPQRRLRELQLIVDLAFTRLEDDLKEVSNRCGLCVGTLKRLKSQKLSLHVEVGTIQAVSYAAGFNVQLSELGYQVRSIKLPRGKGK